MTREKLGANKVPILHFQPEGYFSGGDPEFLESFLDYLRANGYDPGNLVFSGFDGSKVLKGQPVDRHPFIFAMNEAGWRAALKHKEHTPAEYAEGWSTPCIGLYDKGQLVDAYSSDIDESRYDERFELVDIEMGEPLSAMPPDRPVEEAVVHENYPESSPTDVLVGLVFIKTD